MKKAFFVILFWTLMGAGYSQSTHWVPAGGFENNMTAEAIVFLDGEELMSPTVELGAFCGDQCRGAVLPFENSGHWWYFILISGIADDTITFRLYDHSIENELYVECANELVFVANQDIDPYYVEFTTTVITNITPGNWNDSTIWGGIVPGPGAAVVIGADCTVDADVEVGTLVISGNSVLTILFGNTLTVTDELLNDSIDQIIIKDGAQVINESPNVKATVEKDVTAYTAKDSNGWHLISSSVNEMPIAGSEFLTETYDLYRYNESTPAWENYRIHDDFTRFENGRGYLYANNNTFSPGFQGDLNYADVPVSLTYTLSSGALKGVNVIGNPFPHNIYKGVGGAIDNVHLQSGYYSLNYDGGWDVHTYEDSIRPGQGILVRTTANVNLDIVKTNAKATGESSAKGLAGRLKMVVSGTNCSDRAFAYFSEGLGLEKMDNLSESLPTLSIRSNDQDYAIAHLGNECEELDVVFQNSRNDDFTMTFELKDLNFSYLHLIDNITGEDVDMLLEQSYTFHANGNEYAERFKVIMRDTTGFGENAETATFAYISGDNIVVNGEGVLEIIDMTGRIVNTMHINGLNMVNKPADGVYVLRIINGSDVKTQKIVVR